MKKQKVLYKLETYRQARINNASNALDFIFIVGCAFTFGVIFEHYINLI